jgi:hypothetical protein
VTLRRHESLLTMSAFNGLLAIRRYAENHPGIVLPDLITALRRVSADEAYHDYESASVLHGWVAPDQPCDDIPIFFRDTLTVLVTHLNPWWLRISLLGRERVRAALSNNEAQCFEAAGLFSSVRTMQILRWWDALTQRVRAAEDSARLAQGRVGEQLTIEYETRRLSALGITSPPRWISLDDNTAGYDVHSYERGPVEPIAKLIEVKSCLGTVPEIFLTRNEWEIALERRQLPLSHLAARGRASA